VHRYPDAGTFALRRALAEHHDISMDAVCIGNGSNEIIDLVCRTFASPSNHAVFGYPSFVCYELGCTAANVPFTKVPLRDGFFSDTEALAAAVTPATTLLFVANPNNPTGDYVNETRLEALLRSVPSDIVIVVDEAYVEFADADDYRSALEMRGLRERLVVLRTFSKAYGLAGLRIGYGIAPPELIEYLNRVRPPFNAGLLGQVAAIAALGDTDHVAAYIELNRTERARVSRELAALGLRVIPSQANFVLVDFGVPGHVVFDRLLRVGVIVRPTPPPLETCLRITIGLPEDNDRMLAAVRQVARPGGAP
jgi:histidinol-phosphate aminotransferase